MTDYQHDEPRTENDVPFLTGSSEPTGEAPDFTSVATAPKFKMDRWPNVMERTPAQRLLDFNREYERTVAFYEAADDASDLAQDEAAREKTENALAHAERMLKEIRENAYLVPARSIREVALKARIMSHAKGELWDPANSPQHDADIRFLVEDVLALGGLDRIKPRDLSFERLMPGYTGPARIEADASFSAPQAPSWSANRKAVATAPATTADEALNILAREVNNLAEQEEALHQARGRLDESDPQFEAIGKKAGAIEDLLQMKWTTAPLIRPETHAGLAAKARIAHSMRYTLEGCVVPEATPLLLSIGEDAMRLNVDRRKQLWAAQDAAVIQAANEVRRLSAENDAFWGADPELADDSPRQIEWKVKAVAASDKFEQAVAHLASLTPQTLAGMAMKASAAASLTSFSNFVENWIECDLMLSIAADAQRIGAGLGNRSVPHRMTIDQPLIELANNVVDLAKRSKAADDKHKKLYAQYCEIAPPEPASRSEEAFAAAKSVLDAYHQSEIPKSLDGAIQALADAENAKRAVLDLYAAEYAKWEADLAKIDRDIGLEAVAELQNDLFDKLLSAVRRLTFTAPFTIEGFIAKSEASTELTRCGFDEERVCKELAEMIIREVSRLPSLGSATAPDIVRPNPDRFDRIGEYHRQSDRAA